MKQDHLTKFLKSVELFEDAYEDATFNYIAAKKGDDLYLVKGRLFLTINRSLFEDKAFNSDSIVAESAKISNSGINYKQFIEQAIQGAININNKTLHFKCKDAHPPSMYYNPFHQEGIRSQQRINVFNLNNDLRLLEYIQQPDVDWELMAAEQPFDNLQALSNEYGLSGIDIGNNSAFIEVVASPILLIDNETTSMKENLATITLRLSSKLEEEKVSVGYSITNKSYLVTDRKKAHSKQVSWKQKENYKEGTLEIEVPENSIIHCFACYGGVAQHHYWVVDDNKTFNPRYSAYTSFDKEMSILKNIINNTNGRIDSRKFETSISWLLWLLGFNVAHLDGVKGLDDVPDIIATTPNGHYLVVECTTGILQDDRKIPRLYDRTEKVRNSLQVSNHFFDVLPVIVTSKTKAEVASEIETTEKHGIFVITKEDIEKMIGDLQIPVQLIPDQIYTNAFKQVNAAKEKYNNDLNPLSFVN